MKRRTKIISFIGLVIFVLLSIPAFNFILFYRECGHFDVEKDLINGTNPNRYEYWTCYANSGWADTEQIEFKLLYDKYGAFGKSGTHGFWNDEVAIWVSQDIPQFPNYFIRISLYKNVVTKKLRMMAALEWRDEGVASGNPEVEMDIPMSEFDNILNNWLSTKNIKRLIRSAEGANWQPVKFEESNKLRPPIKVKYST